MAPNVAIPQQGVQIDPYLMPLTCGRESTDCPTGLPVMWGQAELSCISRMLSSRKLCDAAIESVHTVMVLASVDGAAKMARGSSFAGPDFNLTFANDYSSKKTSHESGSVKGEILALTKIANGFAADISFSGQLPSVPTTLWLCCPQTHAHWPAEISALPWPY